MNDLHGLLPGYYGLKPQGKPAPMAPPRFNSPFDFGIPSDSSVSDEGDFGNLGGLEYVFGASSRATDSFFSGPADSSSSPVFDYVPVYDDLLPGFGESTAPSNRNPLGSSWDDKTTGGGATGSSRQASSVGSPQWDSEKKRPGEEYHEFPSFATYSASVDSHRSTPNPFSSSHVNASDDTTSQWDASTAYDSNLDSSDDVWLTVSEILLATQPTVSPPPSRPPPPKPPRFSKGGTGSNAPPYVKNKINDHSSFPTSTENPKSAPAGEKSSFTSTIDGLEDFSKGRSGNDPEEDRMQRENEKKEQEQRRIERERIERDRVRQSVERAMREARERAAAEARSRAEKAAVMKVQDEARERAEMAAVLKAQAAALERDAQLAAQLAAEAKQRADREKAEREGKQKAERDAKEKEAHAKAEAARANQKKNEDDLMSFFEMGSHPSTASRPGASSSPALIEKNQRDLEAQQEQVDRERISETFDAEIKRWSAGKEGNLRSLLSTLQYVLWPECGWKPVSLTDLITGESVKKVYWKATLLIHPDKTQQKGATLQQKYIAEKVFHLLQEAWNKYKSEELF